MRLKSSPGVLEGVVVVLDRPRDITNVGGVVRAMGNFGLSRLRLVEPAAYNEGRVLAVAHRGRPIIDRMERYPTLDDALADCIFVLGTTARVREVRHERMTPRQAAPALLRAATLGLSGPPSVTAHADGGSEVMAPHDRIREGGFAAILFGPEDNGLSNEALGRCNAVVTVPTAAEYSSLNLAQATLLIGYELWLAATEDPTAVRRVPDAVAALDATETPAAPDEPPARVAAREEMIAALEDVLWGMHPNNDAGRVHHTLARLRAVLLRAAPRAEEVHMLTRLFVHIARERSRK
jgi:tRNA C32,U32 (ribose-2'-O)-methylase TrmJ